MTREQKTKTLNDKAQALVASRTTESLCELWNMTTARMDAHPTEADREALALTRAWIGDELEKRDQAAYLRWTDGDEDPTRYYCGDTEETTEVVQLIERTSSTWLEVMSQYMGERTPAAVGEVVHKALQVSDCVNHTDGSCLFARVNWSSVGACLLSLDMAQEVTA